MTKLSGMYAPDGSTYITNTDGNGTVYAPSVGNRFLLVTGTFTLGGTTYTQGQSFGGLITVTGLPVSTLISSIFFQTKFALASLPSGVQVCHFFSANPSSSTFTDNGTFSIAAADVSKLAIGPTNTVGLSSQSGGAGIYVANAVNSIMTTDSNGQVYIALQSNPASETATAGTYSWSFQAKY